MRLHDHLDTTTAQGRLLFNLFASLAGFERGIIRERTKAGLTAARARGRQGGRPKGLSKPSRRCPWLKPRPPKRATYNRTRSWLKLVSYSA